MRPPIPEKLPSIYFPCPVCGQKVGRADRRTKDGRAIMEPCGDATTLRALPILAGFCARVVGLIHDLAASRTCPDLEEHEVELLMDAENRLVGLEAPYAEADAALRARAREVLLAGHGIDDAEAILGEHEAASFFSPVRLAYLLGQEQARIKEERKEEPTRKEARAARALGALLELRRHRWSPDDETNRNYTCARTGCRTEARRVGKVFRGRKTNVNKTREVCTGLPLADEGAR